MANTLKFGDGKWAVKEGSTLAYNDENGNYKPLPFTFDRAGSATRVNKQGLIEVVPNNEPRIDFLNDSKGALLLEPQRSNLVTYSEDFTDASWIKLGAGTGSQAVVTQNYSTSPNGTQNATRLQCSLNGGTTASDQSLIYFIPSGSSNSYTNSIYVKGVSGQTFTIGRDLNNNKTVLTDGSWQRVDFTYVNTPIIFIGSRGTTGSDDVLDLEIWGAQLEQGSYATSYIPTQGSIGTRVAEDIEQTVPSNIFNSVEGVIYTEISSLSNDGTQRRFTFGDANFSNNIRFTYISTDNVFEVNLFNGSDNGKLSFTLTNATELNKIAYLYSTNDFQLWINGVKVDFVNSGTTFSSGTIVRIAQGDSSAQRKFYGNIKDLKVYNTKLSNAELQALTKI